MRPFFDATDMLDTMSAALAAAPSDLDSSFGDRGWLAHPASEAGGELACIDAGRRIVAAAATPPAERASRAGWTGAPALSRGARHLETGSNSR